MSNINVNTITPLAGTSGTVSVSGSLLVSGNITAQGNLTFGNQDTDSVSFGAEISSSIIPDANQTYNLGSATKRWNNLYIASASINHILSSGSTGLTILSGSINYLSGPVSVASNLIPNADNAFDLGSSTLEWKDLWVDGNANIDTLTNVSGAVAGYKVDVSASLVPATNTIWDLGSTTKEWKDLYVDGKAFVDTIANQTNDVLISASLTPNASATYTFGTTAKQWKHIAGVSASFSHKVGIGLTSNPINALDVVGSISSSGHISSSNVGAAAQLTSPTASFGATPSNTTNIAGNVIYAHGNISSSGTVFGLTGSFGRLEGDGSITASGLVSAQTMSIANGATPSGMQLSILGNASASGHISASQVGASIGTFSNITASANISTSAATSKATFSSASVTYRLGVGSTSNPPEALTVVGNTSGSGHATFSSASIGTPASETTNPGGTTLYVHGAASASGEIEGGSVTAATVSSSNTVSALTASFGTVPSATTNLAGTPLYVHGNVSASGTGSVAGLGVNTGTANVTAGTISGSGFNINSTTITGQSGSFGHIAGTIDTAAQGNITSVGTLTSVTATSASIGTTISNTTNISGNPFYVHGNISASNGVFASGILDTNVVAQSGTGAEDLTTTAKNLVWYASTAQATAITLPQATAALAGMTIKIIVGTTNWATSAFKLGFANGGSTVMTGYIRLGASDGHVVDSFVVTANAKALMIDADDPTAAGGAIGSTYLFTYLAADLVHVEANGQCTAGTPALDAAASVTAGI